MAEEASTRFPFISLEKALDKARQMFEGDRSGKPMPVPVAFQLWGYSPKSSGGFQTTGALKYYGLLEDEGANADRKVRLTNEARRYFLDERDEERAAMLAEFALKPALFRWLWWKDRWNEGVPADTVARSHLKLERQLNEQSARSALAIFKENIQFVGLKSNTVPPEPLEAPTSDDSSHKTHQEVAEANLDAAVPTVSRPPAVTGAAVEALPMPGSPIEARISGDRVIISANVDLKGLRRLKKQIVLLEQMLTLDDDDDDDAAG